MLPGAVRAEDGDGFDVERDGCFAVAVDPRRPPWHAQPEELIMLINVATILAATLLGYLAGLLTFKRSLR
ncbi:hypothetical protein Val02_57060 [Virgisporangium aliadipatigenens]|uniref:Uncharacterized protein n=1 Tax=Virgisporangium aliadipatigenens TaxID=741659 RepID=A0A8J4DS45_9ACTN|nr:hypothetical protein Val02_57060 [Virgisporangium aliadipatigenens]